MHYNRLWMIKYVAHTLCVIESINVSCKEKMQTFSKCPDMYKMDWIAHQSRRSWVLLLWSRSTPAACHSTEYRQAEQFTLAGGKYFKTECDKCRFQVENPKFEQRQSSDNSHKCPQRSAQQTTSFRAAIRDRNVGYENGQSSRLWICAPRLQKHIKLLWRVGLQFCAPVAAGAHVHAGDEVPKERQDLDGVEAQHDGELLLQHAHDLEGLEQLDDAEGLQGAQHPKLLRVGARRPMLGADLCANEHHTGNYWVVFWIDGL